ncbi:MAG: DNA-binding protein WhiA [Clostridiales bacterium]|nr:DNA-binding protein WhiA [Clostridiales bacterium]
MSFSSKIKSSLSKITYDNKCCQKAELSAIIRTSGAISLRGFSNVDITIRTENASVARLVFTLFKKIYNLHTELIIRKGSGVKKSNVYEIFIENKQKILLDLGILTDDDSFMVSNVVPKKLLGNDCCPRAYIRGAFLGCGSVLSPESGYHLEFSMHSENFAHDFAKLLDLYELKAKVIARKSNYIVYIKESEKIVDILNVIGAHKALFDFENVRIIKGMRNNVNRIVNCETANLSKTVNASYNQIENIKLLDKLIGLESLPDMLKELAYLRLENEEMSLKELGEIMNPPIGKSGVNHRFKKMEKLIQEILNKE